MSHAINLDLLDNPPRRKECVLCSFGPIWVWELLTGEWAVIHQNSARPSIDPRGGVDEHQALLNQIVFSCHTEERDGAPLLFGDDKGPGRIRNLRRADFNLIIEAFHRVNGTDAAEVEEERAFFEASEEARNGSSEPSASAVSVG